MQTISVPALDREIGVIGYGAMGLSWAYTGARSDDLAAQEVIRAALDLGMTLIDTSNAYADGHNEQLIGRAIKGRRDDVVLATKAGLVDASVNGKIGLTRDGRPEWLKQSAEQSLQRLGVDEIDLFYLHRVDPKVPLAESWGALAELVQEGKAKAIGLSEVSVAQAESVHAIHPVAAIQSELSLWSRDPLGDGQTSDGDPAGDIVGWCGEHEAIFVPFSPLGRGFLTGKIDVKALAENDFRLDLPRFSDQALAANQMIVDVVAEIADDHGVSAAVVSLAWVLAQGRHVIPIPGTRRVERLHENATAADIQLTTEELARLNNLPLAQGNRY